MTVANVSKTRITARIPTGLKTNLELASALRGMTLGGFVTSTLAKEAARVIESERQIQLSARDAEVFFKALDAPPKPNRALQKALKTHQRLVRAQV